MVEKKITITIEVDPQLDANGDVIEYHVDANGGRSGLPRYQDSFTNLEEAFEMMGKKLLTFIKRLEARKQSEKARAATAAEALEMENSG